MLRGKTKESSPGWAISHTRPTVAGQQPYSTSKPKKNKSK